MVRRLLASTSGGLRNSNTATRLDVWRRSPAGSAEERHNRRWLNAVNPPRAAEHQVKLAAELRNARKPKA